MTEKTAARRIAEAEVSSRILGDPVFAEILNEIREDAISDLIGSEDRRSDNIALVRAVELLRAALQSRVTTGRRVAEKGQ